MRGLCLAIMLVVATSCGGSDLAAPTDGSPSDSAHVVPEVPTNTVVLSFLSAGVTDTTLLEGKESLVQQFQVYAPCHPLFDTGSGYSIRPVVGCPLPYKVWDTQLDVAPATVMNASASPAVITATVYSDNAYVYQQQQTIQPGSRAVVPFGSMQMGYVCSDGYPMLITVSLRASGADLVLIRSTAEVAGAYAPKFPDFPKVWGSAVVLFPLTTEAGVCVIVP
jgi:hypothetical protein